MFMPHYNTKRYLQANAINCGWVNLINNSMKYISHQFRPTETVTSVIRYLGRHNYTREELDLLLTEFDRINDKKVPRVGDLFEIPILD